MFFFLSKALSYLTLPLFWWLALFLWAYLTRNEVRRKTLVKIGFWSMLLTSNPLIVNTVCLAWENRPVPIKSLKDTFDIGVVLGGFSNMQILKDDPRLQFGVPSNRLTDALYLYKKGIIRKILISSGDGEIFSAGVSEAREAKDFVLTMGVKPEDLILEEKSKNTHENALFTQRIVSQIQPAPRLLLITSAFHMKRAAACFRKRRDADYYFPRAFYRRLFPVGRPFNNFARR